MLHRPPIATQIVRLLARPNLTRTLMSSAAPKAAGGVNATANGSTTPNSASSDATASVPTPTGVRLTAHNQYIATRLLPTDLPTDPLVLFRSWLANALRPTDGSPAVREPEAMILSTATAAGIPSARAVLLKEVDDTGFLFFTNYNSRKGKELSENPYAALSFHWREVSRQVRVVGRVEKVSRKESEDYFATRPRGSQLGAWVSNQSHAVPEDALAEGFKEVEKRFEGVDVPCPPHWGGWRVIPLEVEFWAGQPSRLHDRFVYTRGEEGEWKVQRLAP